MTMGDFGRGRKFLRHPEQAIPARAKYMARKRAVPLLSLGAVLAARRSDDQRRKSHTSAPSLLVESKLDKDGIGF